MLLRSLLMMASSDESTTLARCRTWHLEAAHPFVVVCRPAKSRKVRKSIGWKDRDLSSAVSRLIDRGYRDLFASSF